MADGSDPPSSDDATPGDDASPGDDPAPGSATAPDDDVPSGADADPAADAGGGEPSLAGKIGGGAKTLLGPLVASKLRIALLLVVGLVALVGAGFFLGVLGAPEVTAVDNSFGDVSQNETVIETNMTVQNPNPVGASLDGVGVDYDVRMNDVHMANGSKEGVAIDSGNSTMHLETVMYNDRIPPWWASHVRNDEHTDVAIDAEVSSSTLGRSKAITQNKQIQTDILGQFASQEDRPINANQPLVEDPVLIVTETDAGWGSVTREETPLNMDFTVHNPNTEPYAITELRYEVTMNDVLVSEGATEDPFVIPGGATDTLETTTNIQNQRLDEWWVSHLNDSVYGHQVSRFQIEFTAVIDAGGQEVVVPLDDLTYAEWIGTDLFSEGGDVGVPPQEDPETDEGIIGGNGSDDSDGSDGGNETDGGDDSDGSDGTDDGSSDDGSGDDGDDGLLVRDGGAL